MIRVEPCRRVMMAVHTRLRVSEVDPVLGQVRSGFARVELESHEPMLHGIVEKGIETIPKDP
jgi:hypothetical protein